jgi:hypothetical protein
MFRVLLVLLIVVTGCAWNPFDPRGLRKFPRTTTVDEELHLSPQDCDQIFRLVYKQSSQRISSVIRGPRKNTVQVWCGYDDLVSEVPRLTGDAFTLEKTDATWRIISKDEWMR